MTLENFHSIFSLDFSSLEKCSIFSSAKRGKFILEKLATTTNIKYEIARSICLTLIKTYWRHSFYVFFSSKSINPTRGGHEERDDWNWKSYVDFLIRSRKLLLHNGSKRVEKQHFLVFCVLRKKKHRTRLFNLRKNFHRFEMFFTTPMGSKKTFVIEWKWGKIVREKKNQF